MARQNNLQRGGVQVRGRGRHVYVKGPRGQVQESLRPLQKKPPVERPQSHFVRVLKSVLSAKIQ